MDDLAKRCEELCLQLEAKLGAKGSSFDKRIRKLGRTLPRALRRDADEISRALALQGHPKLGSQIDRHKLTQVFANFDRYLAKIDPLQRKLDRAIGITASFAFGFLLLAAVALAVLGWRGLL